MPDAPAFVARRTDAWETIGRPTPGRVLYTCEHASNRVPRPWRPRPHDRVLLSWHWGYDIGAAELTRSLVRRGGGAGVLARFSRLLVDANRAPDDPTAVVPDTRDGPVGFNHGIGEAAVTERFRRFHAPFHEAVDASARALRPAWLVSVHSFTDWYGGRKRTLEAGVLYDRYDDTALALVDALRAEGLRTEPNAPYSGKDGLIYSAARHGVTLGLRYLEIEVRQDLLASDRAAVAMARRVYAALRAVGIEPAA